MASSPEKPLAQSTPAPPVDALKIYELAYKKGYVLSKLYFKGAFDLRTAIQKGKDYCAAHSLHFINVYDWLKDIDDMGGAKDEI
jgi:hypothetical protein